MASGRALNKDISIEEIKTALKETFGNMVQTARKLGVHVTTLYDQIDLHRDLKETREAARKHFLDFKRELSHDTVEVLMNKVHEEPALATKNAHFILSNDKASPYYKDSDASKNTSITDLEAITQ